MFRFQCRRTKTQIESIVHKLGDQGLEAIGKLLEQADAGLAGVDHLGNFQAPRLDRLPLPRQERGAI